MNPDSLDIVILGLSITSSWGNGHATTYRGLVRELSMLGHRVLFLERDVPWYAIQRDLPSPPYCETALYASLEELNDTYRERIREADVVMIGSYVPQGVVVCEWVLQTAEGLRVFYDIDTPITLANLQQNKCEFLTLDLIPQFDLYLSFTGGPMLQRLETIYGAAKARPLYCSVDAEVYRPMDVTPAFDFGYMGTYSSDRQPGLEQLLLEPARRQPELKCIVAGPLYPQNISWPANVQRIDHLAPEEHRAFYCNQRFTLNITRADMIAAGYSPSVRLFEAAACGVPIISDWWEGLDSFLVPGREILISRSPEETLHCLLQLPEEERQAIALRARERVLTQDTARHRALQFEQYAREALESLSRP